MIVFDKRDDVSSLGDDSSSVVTEAQYIGSQFARTIIDISTGHYKPKPKKKPEAFKTVFWDDPKYNPPLKNTHICCEYDAHYIEEKAHWNKSGKKFTNEPRLAKIGEDMGPKKPDAFPHFFETGTQVFKRNGVIRPNDRVFKPPEKIVTGVELASKWSSKLGPMTYTLPDLWNHVAPPNDSTKKHVGFLDSKVPRFQENDESPIKKAVKFNSIKNCNPSIETRPYTPFPILSEEDEEMEQETEEEEEEEVGPSTTRHQKSEFQVTPLGGKAVSQQRLARKSTPISRKYVPPPTSITKSNSMLSLSLQSSQSRNISTPKAVETKSPGFRFSKTGPVPTQWAIPACLPDVTYKRISLGNGPNSAVILPVDPENAEEELASLMQQLNLPQNEAKIGRSWAQTQFVAEHDPRLKLNGTPKSAHRSSFGSTLRTIENPLRSSLVSEAPRLPSPGRGRENMTVFTDNTDELPRLSSSLSAGNATRDMINGWRPPQVFSKKMDRCRSHDDIARARPTNWTISPDEHEREHDLSNGIVYGDYSRDLDILNYYNKLAMSQAERSPNHRARATTAPAPKTGRYNDRLQIRSTRKPHTASALSMSSSAATTLIIEKKISALKQFKHLTAAPPHNHHEEKVQADIQNNEIRIMQENSNQGIVDDLKGSALPENLDQDVLMVATARSEAVLDHFEENFE